MKATAGAPRPTQALGTALLGLVLLLPLGLVTGCALSTSVPATPSNRYAIVIGVQDYPGADSDLSYPDNDADDMATLLSAQGWTVIKRLIASSEAISTDGVPNRANIQAAIAGATATIGSDSTASLLVYYSGHGSVSGSTAYIIPSDGITAGGSLYQSDWITPATLTSWMTAVPAKNRILILDSCYSGGFALSDSAVDLSPADYSALYGATTDSGAVAMALSQLSSLIAENLANYGDASVEVLAAAGSGESSYDDSSHGNGAFTYYLLKAVTAADSDADGLVTLDEAYLYCKAQLKANWNALHAYSNDDFLPHISGGTGDPVLYSN